MAKDVFHNHVKEALIKAGWVITHDPYFLKDYDPEWEIDLGAERLLGAQKGNEKIAVEIKSFIAESFAYEFHKVLGQFMNYSAGLEIIEKDRLLFLAVPSAIYEQDFQRKGVKISIEKYHVKILVFDIEKKEITAWIN